MLAQRILVFPSLVSACVMAVAVTMIGYSSCAGQSIVVDNPSFEDDVTAGFVFTINDWNRVASSDSGTFNPGPSSYPGGLVPDGDNVAFSSVGGPIISQTLADVLQADLRYTLLIEVGNRLEQNFPGYEIELLAGGQVLASDSNSLTPLSGEFLTSVVSYNSSAADSQLGQALEIRFRSFGSQVNFDNVRLNAQSIPEPSGMAGWLIFSTNAFLRRRKCD